MGRECHTAKHVIRNHPEANLDLTPLPVPVPPTCSHSPTVSVERTRAPIASARVAWTRAAPVPPALGGTTCSAARM